MKNSVKYMIEHRDVILSKLRGVFKSQELAEEAMSCAYIKLLSTADAESNPSAYVYTITFNEAKRLYNLNKKRLSREVHLEFALMVPYEGNSPEEALHNKMFEEKVSSHIKNKSSVKSGEVLHMLVFEDMNLTEIAEKLGKNLETTRSLIKVSRRNGAFKELERYVH